MIYRCDKRISLCYFSNFPFQKSLSISNLLLKKRPIYSSKSKHNATTFFSRRFVTSLSCYFNFEFTRQWCTNPPFFRQITFFASTCKALLSRVAQMLLGMILPISFFDSPQKVFASVDAI